MTFSSGWIWVPLFCFPWFPSTVRFSHDHSAKQTMHQNEWIRVWTSFYFGTRISWFDSQNLISQDWTAIDKSIKFSILLDPRNNPLSLQFGWGCRGLMNVKYEYLSDRSTYLMVWNWGTCLSVFTSAFCHIGFIYWVLSLPIHCYNDPVLKSTAASEFHYKWHSR